MQAWFGTFPHAAADEGEWGPMEGGPSFASLSGHEVDVPHCCTTFCHALGVGGANTGGRIPAFCMDIRWRWAGANTSEGVFHDIELPPREFETLVSPQTRGGCCAPVCDLGCGGAESSSILGCPEGQVWDSQRVVREGIEHPGLDRSRNYLAMQGLKACLYPKSPAEKGFWCACHTTIY